MREVCWHHISLCSQFNKEKMLNQHQHKGGIRHIEEGHVLQATRAKTGTLNNQDASQVIRTNIAILL
jgi:hypothetical protein